MKRIRLALLGLLLPLGGLTADQEVPFETYSGYFVSNKFEPDAATSFVVLQDQPAFDAVFGAGFVMDDKSHRLAPGTFASRLVASAIHRGAALVNYDVERVTTSGQTLTIRYRAKSEPQASATFACPLILSLPKGSYTNVQFVENGQLLRSVPVP